MKVSICCITYNHETFIATALDSFLMQKTTFNYEIIVSDDNSQDDTRRILTEYKKKYPDKIKLLLNEVNIQMIPNFIQALNNCTGEYIAICDGDDYWTDNLKLQKQVDLLDAHKDHVISSHSTIVLNNEKQYLYPPNVPLAKKKLHNTFTISDYIQNFFCHSSSIVFRRSMLKPFPDWYKNVFSGDGFLVMLLAMEGKITYLNKPMSVYRYNNTSISNYFSLTGINKNFEKHLKLFDEYSGYKFSKEIKEKIFALSFGVNFYNYNYLKKLKFFFKNFFRIIKMNSTAFPVWGRYKFLLPAQILKSRVNITEKKTGRMSSNSGK